jgi:putative flippase GtrA
MKQFLHYAITGGVAACVDIGLFLVLSRAIDIPAAGSVSFIFAAVVNYLLSSRMVFRSPYSFRHFALFFFGALLGMAVNVGVLTVCVYFLCMQPVFGKVCGIAAAFVFNYIINKLFVFRSRKA